MSLSDVLNSFNDAAIKALTTKDHRGVWKDMGKSIFSGAAKTGLQDAEGYAMGAAEKIPGISSLISKLHPGRAGRSKVTSLWTACQAPPAVCPVQR